jgi:class 3 adenylate cyclase
MFCDLVDSTGIAAKLDAEEWRDLVNAYLDDASKAVMEMGGHVAKKLGDGLMALFGYPVAHENDAERAARAALSIQRALADLNRKNAGIGKPKLKTRIGLETGPVVVDATGEVYGDVPNTAARVQALAKPSAVLMTAQVQRQVAGLFVVEERGCHQLKGVPEPVTLFRLIRASGGGRRSGVRQLTPFVGREEEMATLTRRWERARQGEGQLVLIVGEPGLGKSRLIEEFHGRLRDSPHTWLEWSCSQLLQNTPLHPIAEWGDSGSAVLTYPPSDGSRTSKARMVGQGRRAGAAPFSLPGGNLASRQGHRDSRQNRRAYVRRRDRIRFGRPTAQTTNRPW